MHLTIDNKPAFIAEKLTHGRVRITTEDRTQSLVATAAMLLDTRGHFVTVEQPTARDRRIFNPKPINPLKAALGL